MNKATMGTWLRKPSQFREHATRLMNKALVKLPCFTEMSLERDQLRAENDQLRSELYRYQYGWPPGHFYSPIPSIEEVKLVETQIFDNIPSQIAGVELQEEAQICLFHELKRYYDEQPFSAQKTAHLRYYFENPNYTYGEAIILYCILRHLQPKRVIELGSGYSSCAILDTNELFLGNAASCTFIEPFPELLRSLLKDEDVSRVTIVPKKVQDVNINLFEELAGHDILFVDSSHVCKVNSDVNFIVFEILPRLREGVYIHFHDIGYPFEYPKEWIYQGRAWNEAYLLRAFLQYNRAFEIRFFNSFFGRFHPDLMSEMPLLMRNPGTSIWLRKAGNPPKVVG